jgi:hypothetical protein
LGSRTHKYTPIFGGLPNSPSKPLGIGALHSPTQMTVGCGSHILSFFLSSPLSYSAAPSEQKSRLSPTLLHPPSKRVAAAINETPVGVLLTLPATEKGIYSSKGHAANFSDSPRCGKMDKLAVVLGQSAATSQHLHVRGRIPGRPRIHPSRKGRQPFVVPPPRPTVPPPAGVLRASPRTTCSQRHTASPRNAFSRRCPTSPAPRHHARPWWCPASPAVFSNVGCRIPTRGEGFNRRF